MARSPVDHDRAPEVPDQDPTDALGSALDDLQVGGAIFLRAHYSEGWAFRSVPNADMGALLAPEARRIVPFHVVDAGRCWIEVSDERYWAEAGDVIVLPYGDRHRMGGTQDAVVVDVGGLVPQPPWTRMPFIEHGQGGALTHIVCGYITCDDPLFDAELGALAPVIVVRPEGAAAQWVRASVDFALQRTGLVDDAHAETPAQLVRLLLIEVLRLHLASVPAADRGFVRALHDPVVAPAMAEIHRAPEVRWTVRTLAAASNVSPSLLDDRFRSVLGMPPIRYLTSWRMHRAQHLLSTTDLGVASIARRVGYESEEAFSRAFKRKHGVAPSRWRGARPRRTPGIGSGNPGH
ncbi:AraC family transcriptional regulator [Nocardioides albidus]|uniref:AraC family transcriptional regulator n=1 Tax=Nocardioides albidus TaxID=1517589 RepID=UPI001F030C9C|nr:AraC family transcriptional regulator [Nocardioides albidus]